MIYLLLKLRIMIADNVGKGDLCDSPLQPPYSLKKGTDKLFILHKLFICPLSRKHEGAPDFTIFFEWVERVKRSNRGIINSIQQNRKAGMG
ncbi:hypothetical protein BPLS_P6307 [Bathymodiolus platifrons methanotrophic gill symbiont]|nr:hypothetical protein BPLS_P6307 [Bathymodiolus platifrons methanotrophic gill symbiont]